MIDGPQLCLGTVQFGLPYGITNHSGQVPENEVRRILDLAAASGINLLDTAQAYGTAEIVLGRCWPADVPRRLISKLPAGACRQNWENVLITSLERLQVPKLHGLLFASCIGSAGAQWRCSPGLDGEFAGRGLVERIGVSIYGASELDGLPLNRLQLVQLPLSVYDQRLVRDGTVDKLQNLGVAVHVRSVFLQGLLLQSPDQWPDHLSAEFRVHHASWLEHLHQDGISPLAGALGFVRAIEGVEAVLVGVASGQELAQVLQAWEQKMTAPPEALLDWAWERVVDLDPRCWPPR